MGGESERRREGTRCLSRLLKAWLPGRKGNDDDVLASRGLASLVHLDLWSRHPQLGPAAHTNLDDALRFAQILKTSRPGPAGHGSTVRGVHHEGRRDRARVVCGEALDIAETAGDDYWRMRFLTWRAIAANAAGDSRDALEDAMMARDISAGHLVTTTNFSWPPTSSPVSPEPARTRVRLWSILRPCSNSPVVSATYGPRPWSWSVRPCAV